MKDLRILHVTEVMQGGVADFLASIVSKQLEESAGVYIFYPELKQPIKASEFLDNLSEGSATQINQTKFAPIRTSERLLRTLKLLIRMRRFLVKSKFEVVHLHSSFAGLGRFPGLIQKKKTLIVFSPHGLSFLQSNHSSKISRVFLTIEKYLASRDNLFICTSSSEADLVSNQLIPRNQVLVVTNGIEHEIIRDNPRTFPKSRFRIAMIGRITYQKAPWVFNEISEACKEHADFSWIGSDPGLPIKWLNEQNIQISPWLRMEELIEELENVDLLVHSSLWEGFPLSVALAQGRGIPALVSDVIGNRDAISPEHSGFVCQSVFDYENRIKQIIGSEALYEYLSNGSITYARESLSNRDLGKQTIQIYKDHTIIEN